MYAVVKIGGHQYRVSEGDVLFVDKQSDETDQKLTFDEVLLTNDDGNVTVGQPVVEGAAVEATLLDNVKSDKVIVFKKKRRKGYQVKRGHRQPMSQIEINSISTSGSGSKKKAKKAKDTSESEESGQVSTDMTAKEAISHIRNTDLEDLKGFVPDDEERVTVLDAWNSKQEG
ncbi:50S ribosomal protein L21 [Aliifodinibius salipaludis]|uniref:Large ribosomal subunit protein bL21 n=1 Tax=Fodinibius salipaludis TaxID=2032627 RepID=A0A2A2GDX6_9BACT|nr:50S ribosomal protein L21 [Aliifodinibius salipaludis]PAU95846.1 50S ribosomal protein L21 [Aliifodinibius salipaludis]